MTVKELIQKLEQCPEDSIVIVDAYEGDYNLADEIAEFEVAEKRREHTNAYMGDYASLSEYTPEKFKPERYNAVHIY